MFVVVAAGGVIRTTINIRHLKKSWIIVVIAMTVLSLKECRRSRMMIRQRG